MTLLEAALNYGEQGFSVIPVEPGGKRPLIEWAEFQNRQASEDEIRRWWATWPDANIGIVTGAVSGIVALDADGEEGRAVLAERHCPETAVSRTPRGLHYLYGHPGFECNNFAKKLPGLDFRGDGGFIVAPPSTHPSGKRYEWILSPEDTEFAPCPDWLLDVLRNGRRPKESAAPIGVSIPEGERNSTLTSLAGTMRRRGMGVKAIFTALVSENAAKCRPRLPDDEVRRIALSVARYAPGEDDTETPSFRFTDLGNAERLVHRFGRDIRFVADWRRWIVWDAVRWAPDRDLRIERLAKETVRRIYAEAEGAEDEKERKNIAQWAMRSESSERLAAMVRLAESSVTITADRLDLDPFLLCCENGVLDLRNGELLTPCRENFITKQVKIAYDPQAGSPTWLSFLRYVLPEPELRDYVRKAVGYTLTADVSEQCLFFLFGSGANGKTTFIELLSDLLGGYFTKARSDTLMVKRNPGIPNDVAVLAGSRLVTVSELSGGQRLDEGLVKDLTGGDTLAARFLHAEMFNFRAGFKLWLYGNHKPTIRGKDLGIWRRIRLIPFTVQIPEAERDPHMADRLRAELPGILAWAVQGCLAWQEEGLREPDAVLDAVNEYRAEQDALADFLAENCIFERRVAVPKKDLWQAYEQWADGLGEDRFDSKHLFNDEIRQRPGVKSGFGHGHVAIWKGVGLQSCPEPADTEALLSVEG